MNRRHESRRNRHWRVWNGEKKRHRERKRRERARESMCTSGTFREHSMHCHSRPTLGPPSRQFETTSSIRVSSCCLNYIGVAFVPIYTNTTLARICRYAYAPAIFSSYQRTIISALHRYAIARDLYYFACPREFEIRNGTRGFSRVIARTDREEPPILSRRGTPVPESRVLECLCTESSGRTS